MNRNAISARQTHRNVLVFFLLYLGSSLTAAFAISSRQQMMLYSQEINDSIKIDIQLPDSYARFPDQRYPLIYLLDGDFYFDYAAATLQILSRGIQPFTPEFILVGISSRNRFRDFTPTKAQVNNDGSPVPPNYHVSGGADRFSQFFQHVLQPKIESGYRTNGFKLLFGHSLTGLYAMNLLLKQQASFNAWLLADPSLWWDKELLFRQSPKWLQQAFKPINLYLGYASSISIPPGIDTTLMADCNKAMAQRLQTRFVRDNVATRFYPKCSHGSVVIPAFYDGLCFFFEGYSINPRLKNFDLSMLLGTYQI